MCFAPKPKQKKEPTLIYYDSMSELNIYSSKIFAKNTNRKGTKLSLAAIKVIGWQWIHVVQELIFEKDKEDIN